MARILKRKSIFIFSLWVGTAIFAILAFTISSRGSQPCVLPSTTQVTLCTNQTGTVTFTVQGCATAPYGGSECTTRGSTVVPPTTSVTVGPYATNGNHQITSPPATQVFHYVPTTANANCPDIPVTLPTTQVAVKVLTVHVTAITFITVATQQDVVQPASGPANWAAVKSPTTQAIAQVTIDSNDPNAASQIVWSTGTAVPGQPLQRNISLATSAEVNVEAHGNCNDAGTSVNLWVLWASVQIKCSGTCPAAAVQLFTAAPSAPGGATLGPWLSNDGNSGAGQVCVVGTLTPAGVNAVVPGGWKMPQTRISHDLIDGKHAAYWDPDWTSDGPNYGRYNFIPDASDQIYDIDSPTIGSFGAKNSYNTTNNFRDRVEWHGQPCSDYATWYYQATWTSGANPVISPNNVSTGSCTLN